MKPKTNLHVNMNYLLYRYSLILKPYWILDNYFTISITHQHTGAA